LIIVDSHCHASLQWYEPVESLLGQMERNGVSHAILIQMMGQSDNSYQAECVRRFPGRFASVVIVDTDRPDAASTLVRLAGEGASGIRLGPNTRSPGADPLAIWRTAARLGLAVSCMGTADDFASDQFAQTVRAVPDLRVVVEHLGSLGRPRGEATPDDVVQQVCGLARYPNVFMKVPGLGEFCRRAIPVVGSYPFVQPIPSYLKDALDAFGPPRLMWGSDFPPVSGREGYANALRLTMDQFAGLDDEDRAMIFGKTALSVFPVRS